MADPRSDVPHQGSDTTAANGEKIVGGGDPQRPDAEALLDQLNQTTSEDAGGNVSGTGATDRPGLDIVFEPEADDETGH